MNQPSNQAPTVGRPRPKISFLLTPPFPPSLSLSPILCRDNGGPSADPDVPRTSPGKEIPGTKGQPHSAAERTDRSDGHRDTATPDHDGS